MITPKSVFFSTLRSLALSDCKIWSKTPHLGHIAGLCSDCFLAVFARYFCEYEQNKLSLRGGLFSHFALELCHQVPQNRKITTNH